MVLNYNREVNNLSFIFVYDYRNTYHHFDTRVVLLL